MSDYRDAPGKKQAVRALVFDRTLHVVERPRLVPAADETLIRLRLGGVCSTDLELIRGYKGFQGVLGHEFVGEVVEGPAEWIGKRVAGEINISCGACDMCRRGVPTQCRQRRVLGILDYDGVFADLFRLPVRNLWAVPDALPDEEAVFIEPLAAVCQILDAVHIQPTERVVLIGAGRLGLLAAQVLRLTGADLTVITRYQRQNSLLATWGIRAAARGEVAEGLADVVVDCTGTPEGFADAVALVRPRGTVVLKSSYAGIPQADLTQLVVNEIRVVGSRCGPFEAALRLLEQRLVDVTPLIEARYPLDQAVQAIEHAARPGVLKVLIEP